MDVSRYMLGDEGIGILARALSGVTSLTLLDVRSNGMGSTGACSLAAALQLPTCAIKTLVLGDILRSKRGEIETQDSSGVWSRRKCGDRISHWTMPLINAIGNVGATAIGNMLKINTSLTKLVFDPEIHEGVMAGYDSYDVSKRT